MVGVKSEQISLRAACLTDVFPIQQPRNQDSRRKRIRVEGERRRPRSVVWGAGETEDGRDSLTFSTPPPSSSIRLRHPLSALPLP
ncbi:unnamed protein product [Gadus morhua 'NCC']